MKTTKIISEEYLDKIISVAYADAGVIDRIKVYFDSKRDQEVRRILNEYRETVKGVKLISPEEYQGVLPVKNKIANNPHLNYLSVFIKRPVLSTAMVLMIIGGAAGYIILNNTVTTSGYSKQELLTADRQAKEAFAIVASVFNETKSQLKNKIINKKINEPINKGLSIINTYL